MSTGAIAGDLFANGGIENMNGKDENNVGGCYLLIRVAITMNFPI